MELEISPSGESEAVILIKATPQISKRHRETVCCAAVDLYGNWLRLYPVSFRYLEDGQKFQRWDCVKFRWRLPRDDRRIESRRIDQDTLIISGELKQKERHNFLSNLIVTSLDKEYQKGRSLALLDAEIKEFYYEKKSEDELLSQELKLRFLHDQPDLLNTRHLIPISPVPYKFKYRYRTEDGNREGTCQDWETDTTFFKWKNLYGEKTALELMVKRFGEEIPKSGILLAMGTHSRRQNQWLINGIIQHKKSNQLLLI